MGCWSYPVACVYYIRYILFNFNQEGIIMARPSKMRGISRIDSKNTHGWYVRVYANGGVFCSKLYSDRLYGGKEKALESAIKYRDHNQEVADKYKREGRNPNRKPLYKRAPKNNTTGQVGVNEVKAVLNGREVHYFQATWSENGVPQSKKFYISKKRSREKAMKEAIAYRQKMEKVVLKKFKAYVKEIEKKERDRIRLMNKEKM